MCNGLSNKSMKGPLNTIIRILLPLGLLTLCITLYHNSPQMWHSAVLEGAIIIKKPYANALNKLGPHEIIHYEHGGLINRINQRRDSRLIKTYPQLFGPTNAFKPLLKIITQGPGTIKIAAKAKKNSQTPTNPMIIPIDSGNWEIDVYPDYILEKLFTGHSHEQETLHIEFEGPQFPKQKVLVLNINWSGPSDLFLSTLSLVDIASFVTTNTHPNPSKPINVPDFIFELKNQLNPLPIRYDPDSSEILRGGWQSIKSFDGMLRSEKANCLDMSAWIAAKAIENDLKPFILANSGHAFCAITTKTGKLADSNPVEGASLIKPPLPPQLPPTPPRSPTPKPSEGKPKPVPKSAPKSVPKNEPDATSIFEIDILHWAQFYRKNPQRKNDLVSE